MTPRRALRKIAATHKRWGYRRAHAHLLTLGWRVNGKRVQRIWREEGLRVPAKAKKRRRAGSSSAEDPPAKATHPGHVWTLDYQHDATDRGTELRFLNIVDEFTRECLAIEVGRSFTADATVEVLVGLVARLGAPANIRCDNGPELTAAALKGWCEETKVADSHHLHRAGLSLGEPLDRIAQRPLPRRGPRLRDLQLGAGGAGDRYRLAPNLQPPAPALGAGDAGAGGLR